MYDAMYDALRGAIASGRDVHVNMLGERHRVLSVEMHESAAARLIETDAEAYFEVEVEGDMAFLVEDLGRLVFTVSPYNA